MAERARRVLEAGGRDRGLGLLAERAERWSRQAIGESLPAIEAAIETALALDHEATVPRLLRSQTAALAYAGRLGDALAAAERAGETARRLGDEVESARADLAGMHPLTKLGRFDDAVTRGESARAILERCGQTALAARADINLGNLRKARGEIEAARVHLERARGPLAGEPAMLAHVDNTLGEVHFLADDFAASRAAFSAALGHFEASGDRFAAAIVRGNLADLAAREGDIDGALAEFELARQALAHDTASGHLARLAAEEAEAIEALGSPADAAHALDASIAELVGAGLIHDAARARLARARAAARLGDEEEAGRHLEDVLEHAQRSGDAVMARRARLLGAELALSAGRARDAHDLASACLDGASATERIVALHHLAGAELAIEGGDRELARAAADEALALARELGMPILIADLLLVRASLHEDRSARLADLEEAVGAVERVRSSLRAERLRAQWLGSRGRAFEALAGELLNQPSPAALAAAFEAVERSKSRALLDLVRRLADRGEPHGEPAAPLAAEIAHLRRRLNALYARWEADGPLGGVGGERLGPLPTARLVSAIRHDEAELVRAERRLAAQQGPASVLAPLPSADAIRERLGPTELLIEYAALGDELVAFLVDRTGIAVRRGLASMQAVERLAATTLFHLRRGVRGGPSGARGAGEALRHLRGLHDLLIAPLRPSLERASHVVIVPHGPLHGLPFHAFFDGQRFAIERWAVRTAPSAALAVPDRAADAATVPSTPLVVGVADSRAPAIAQEIAAVAALHDDPQVLVGEDATVARFVSAARHHRLLHLACHGRFSDAVPHASGLRLADRWLSVREILDLRLRSELVILAGCETGRTALGPGDDAVGLPRAFLAAGADSVLVSLWPVRDEATSPLMAALHTRLAPALADSAPMPVAEVWAATVRDTIAADRSTHPALWAPFTLIGGHRPSSPNLRPKPASRATSIA